jgi:putative spermidine/putrescine transport system permease protein
MKQNRFWSWVVFAIGAIYFLVPLLATVQFSLSIRRGTLSLDAYANVIQSPDFQQTFLYSLVFGYIRLYSSSSVIPLTTTAIGTNILLTLAYVALALPYMYRAVDTGLRTIDVQTLTEAANILGANTFTIVARVIFPNILVAVLSGAFLTLAIVIGEFTIASLLNRPAFGVYMQNVGANRAFEPAALAVISFVITWGAMGMIQLLARFAPRTAPR